MIFQEGVREIDQALLGYKDKGMASVFQVKRNGENMIPDMVRSEE